MQCAASLRVHLHQGDVSQAFLTGMPIDREVYLALPKEGLDGVEPGSLLELKKAAYGFSDAPRSWWRQFHEGLHKAGWEESEVERAVHLERLLESGGPT